MSSLYSLIFLRYIPSLGPYKNSSFSPSFIYFCFYISADFSFLRSTLCDLLLVWVDIFGLLHSYVSGLSNSSRMCLYYSFTSSNHSTPSIHLRLTFFHLFHVHHNLFLFIFNSYVTSLLLGHLPYLILMPALSFCFWAPNF